MSLYDMYIVGSNTALVSAIRNNKFKGKGIRFGTGVTLKEYDNNQVDGAITAYPTNIIRGRKVNVYHGTRANVPVSATGYLNGDRYEYTDPVAWDFIGLILTAGVWKPYGAISA